MTVGVRTLLNKSLLADYYEDEVAKGWQPHQRVLSRTSTHPGPVSLLLLGGGGGGVVVVVV
eukprot:128406-Prorocentrum_lima.AAC.1